VRTSVSVKVRTSGLQEFACGGQKIAFAAKLYQTGPFLGVYSRTDFDLTGPSAGRRNGAALRGVQDSRQSFQPVEKRPVESDYLRRRLN
jgi:hypothetical protein